MYTPHAIVTALIIIAVISLAGPCVGLEQASRDLWLPDGRVAGIPSSFGQEADKRLGRSADDLARLLEDAGVKDGRPALSPTLFVDLKSLMGIESEEALADGAFDVLDKVNRWDRLLDAANAGFRHAGASASDHPEFEKLLAPKGANTYHVLKAQLRLTQSLARVEVARKFATWESRSYAMQAMESAIDGLLVAVKSAEQSGPRFHGEPPITAAFLSDLRARLLSEWDRGQRTGALEPVRDFSLRRAVTDTLAAHPDASAKKGLGWLVDRGTVLPHPRPLSEAEKGAG